MLRIDRDNGNSGGLGLRLAGEIKGPWVDELRRVAEGALESGTAVSIDLGEVSFVDRPGVALLNRLAGRDVALVNCSPFVTELLRAVSGSAHPLAGGGEAAAIEQLMAEHSGRVYRLAYGITRNHADAEEVTQDVFLTILQKGDTFEGRSALSTWIYRVTANAALNKRRGKRHEVEVSLEEHLPAFEADGHRSGDRAYLMADWSEDPERAALAGETRRTLERALDVLPARYRAVLVLRDVEDVSNEQTAEILGESVASVKSRLHRARMALRELLTRQWAER